MAYWQGKVALITGGSSGLGLAIARRLVNAGAQVILNARDQERLGAAAASLCGSEQQCAWIPGDVTRPEQVDLLATQSLQLHGRLDALFCCAGKSSRGEAAATSAEQFQELFDVNFQAAANCARALAPQLTSQRGHVVLIGSLAGKIASRYLGAYPATKFALSAYAQQLRLELGPRGLHTLLVCPGPLRRDDAGRRYDQQAANLPPAARQPGGGVKLKGIDPDKLASQIMRACEMRRAELVVPARARLLFAIAQLWPTAGDWLVNRMTRS